MTEAQVLAAGIRCDCRVLPLAYVPRALVNRDTRGFIKIVADADTGGSSASPPSPRTPANSPPPVSTLLGKTIDRGRRLLGALPDHGRRHQDRRQGLHHRRLQALLLRLTRQRNPTSHERTDVQPKKDDTHDRPHPKPHRPADHPNGDWTRSRSAGAADSATRERRARGDQRTGPRGRARLPGSSSSSGTASGATPLNEPARNTCNVTRARMRSYPRRPGSAGFRSVGRYLVGRCAIPRDSVRTGPGFRQYTTTSWPRPARRRPFSRRRSRTQPRTGCRSDPHPQPAHPRPTAGLAPGLTPEKSTTRTRGCPPDPAGCPGNEFEGAPH